jgi:hypothetical protein
MPDRILSRQLIDDAEHVGASRALRHEHATRTEILHMGVDSNLGARPEDAANHQSRPRPHAAPRQPPVRDFQCVEIAGAKLFRRFEEPPRADDVEPARLRASPVRSILGTPFDSHALSVSDAPATSNDMTAIAGRPDGPAATFAARGAVNPLCQIAAPPSPMASKRTATTIAASSRRCRSLEEAWTLVRAPA